MLLVALHELSLSFKLSVMHQMFKRTFYWIKTLSRLSSFFQRVGATTVLVQLAAFDWLYVDRAANCIWSEASRRARRTYESSFWRNSESTRASTEICPVMCPPRYCINRFCRVLVWSNWHFCGMQRSLIYRAVRNGISDTQPNTNIWLFGSHIRIWIMTTVWKLKSEV